MGNFKQFNVSYENRGALGLNDGSSMKRGGVCGRFGCVGSLASSLVRTNQKPDLSSSNQDQQSAKNGQPPRIIGYSFINTPLGGFFIGILAGIFYLGVFVVLEILAMNIHAKPNKCRDQQIKLGHPQRHASLASPDCLAEDVLVLAVVVPELELGDVERHVLGADLVERADNATFEDRPEALNRVGVDRADDVLALGVIDDLVRILGVEAAITYPLVGYEEADFLRHRPAHEALEDRRIYVARIIPRHDATLAADCSRRQVSSLRAGTAAPWPCRDRCCGACFWPCRRRRFRQPQRSP